MIEAAILVIFPLCVAMAGFTDMLTMKIPNRISIVLAVSFLIIAPFTGMSLAMFGIHVGSALLVFIGCFVLWNFGYMGGGDVKVIAAASLWYGFNIDLVAFLMITGIYGGFLAITILSMRAWQNTLIVFPIPIPSHFITDRAGIPYGIAIAVAAFSTFPDTWMFARALGRVVM